MITKERKISKSFWALTLVLVMFLTNILGAGEVKAAGVPVPTINKVFYDATTISGAGVHRERVNKKTVRGTVHVTLKDKDGAEKASSVINPTSTTWTYKLPSGTSVAEGDVVIAYQEFNGQKSSEVTANAEPSLAYNHKSDLKMPSGEIWIEKTNANLVNEDEQAEAVQLLKDANSTIVGDIESVKFSIDGTDHAYYEVTYTDGSTPGKIEATGLVIKTVTETSAAPTIEKVQVTDGQIIVTLEKEVAEGTKFYFIKNFTDEEDKTFCQNGKCTVEKSTQQEMSQAVSIDGKKVTFPVKDDDLELKRTFGIVVKEPHKFRSCAKSEPVVTTPDKVDVRDPKKLTDEDKRAIDKAIRDANTVNGKSKLPNSLEGMDYPAFIDFDKDGNARIIDPNYVKGEWDWGNYEDGKFIPEQNADGTYKVKDEDQNKVISIPAKDLLKNIKPDAPTVNLSGDKKNISITPNLEVDTDAHIITVSYKDKDGNNQTTTATKADDGWSITKGKGSVDANGVITLPKDEVKGGTDVTATVTDKGGIADDDKDPLTSDPGTLTIKETKADKVESLGGLDPVDIKKWVGDTVEWKKGVKAKDSATDKDKIQEYINGATVTDVSEPKTRTTNNSGDFEGKVKVKFDDDSEIIVEKQMLYVSDLVSPSDKKNLPDDAIDVELKLGEGVKAGEVEGSKETPVTAKTYKVKPGTDLSTEKVSKTEKTCFEDVGAIVTDDTYVDLTWNDKNKGKDFKATAENNVFTATATKKFKVTLDPNGGGGTKSEETKKSGEKYSLPKGDTFTPPENQEFAGWLVGDATTTTKPGTEITITGDTVIKASWKQIELKVNFLPGTGASGEMTDVPVNKGSDYKLPEPTFTPPTNKEFAGWKVGNEDGVKEAGDTIKITDNVTLTATWKDIMVNVSYNSNGGSGEMEGKELKKGSTFTLPANGFTAPDNQEFKAWEVNGKEVAVGTEITVDKDTVVKAIWKPIIVEVSFDKGEGKGEKDKVSVAKGSEYTLPDSEGFTAPENKEFDGWEINGEAKKVGDKITVTEDTTVTAKWKDKMVDVNFVGNGGGGSMDKATVKKGDEYTLPENGFTAPENKEFDGWEINGENKKVGDKITVTEDTTVTATWKNKSEDQDPNEPGKQDPNEPGKQDPNDPGKQDPNDPGKQDPSKPGRENPNEKPENGGRVQPWPGYWWYFGNNTDPIQATEVKTQEKQEEIEYNNHERYMYGYPDGTVRPEGMMTRAEAAALIARLAKLDMSNDAKPNFQDTESAWYNSAINAMTSKDLMFADKDGNFRPNQAITRAEFARALYGIDKKNDKVAPFADVKGHEFEAAINQAYGNGRINGYPDGTFKPDAYIQRSEAARILNQYANRGVDFDGLAGVRKYLIKFTDIDESHWAYYEIMEATNSHEYKRVRGKQIETWLQILNK